MDASPQAPAASPTTKPNTIAWPWAMQLGLAFLLGVISLLIIQHSWHRIGARGRPAEVTQPAVYLINLNEAREAELMQLPGVGPELATRILAHRRDQSRFASVDELEKVHGIGPVLLERLRPRVVVESGNSPQLGSEGSGDEPRRSQSRKAPPNDLVDLNAAGRDQLMQLPGIGPTLADRILADRAQNGPYQTVTHVTRIKGIKAKTLEKIKPYAVVRSPSATESVSAVSRD